MEQHIPNSRIGTEEEYLRIEEQSKSRHEFRNGEIIDMAGGTEQHAAIAANLIYALRGKLKGTPCKPYGSDLRLRITESGEYVYPDVMVLCGPAQFHPPTSQSIVVNPVLIIEVTSPSTESDDRGRKFGIYRTLASLREYWLVSQEQMEVETFYRQADGIWAIGPRFTQPDSSIALRCEDISLSMSDIYADVQFNRRPRSAADDEPQ